jgi:molybdenum cofactor guanylyltransferase
LEITNSRQDFSQKLPMLEATGILLAGGKSSRMKRNKAFLEYEGKPLVERSLEILQRVFPEVLISSNEPELYKDYKFPVIQDGTLDRGPLEGLYQGLQKSAFETVFFVACDMPFLQMELIRVLFSWASDYEIVVPRFRSVLHPLHAFYHRSCLQPIQKNLEAGHLKIIDFFPACSVRYVEETDLRSFLKLNDALCNVNTPEDWSKVFKR